MKEFSDLVTTTGERVYSYEYIQMLREKDRRKNNPLKIIAQNGAQEKMLWQNVDILIAGGQRGGSKSFSLLMEALADIDHKDFVGLILRNEKDDLRDIIRTSYTLYNQFGQYNRSSNDMTWYFTSGAKLRFSYYADSFDDFKKRFQGQQYAYIGIDEITHCPYRKFKYLITDNRNAAHIKNRFWGTCNPDPDSWVRKFIDWWIDEDGYPIPERDGVVRYCYMDGDTPDSIYWGDTPQEVYEQCKDIIDPLWNDTYEELGFDKVHMFVKSVTFVKAALSDNLKLLASDPSYAANLAQQDEEQRMRDLLGNWNYKNTGDDMIKQSDMENFFTNSYQIGPKRYATCDIAFLGGDSLVMWLWLGWHIVDIYVCRNDSKNALSMVKEKLAEWGVLEEDFAYDLNGLGQTFKGFFPKAVGINNMASPIPTSTIEKESVKHMYANLKSQMAYLLAKRIKERSVSIDADLLSYKFSGDGFSKTPLRDILMKERKCIRQAEDTQDKGFTIIKKKLMKKFVGHSPDYFESLMYRIIFDIQKKHKKPKNLWLI